MKGWRNALSICYLTNAVTIWWSKTFVTYTYYFYCYWVSWWKSLQSILISLHSYNSCSNSILNLVMIMTMVAIFFNEAIVESNKWTCSSCSHTCPIDFLFVDSAESKFIFRTCVQLIFYSLKVYDEY